MRDHQAHLVAPQAARFRWLAGFQFGGQFEIQCLQARLFALAQQVEKW